MRPFLEGLYLDQIDSRKVKEIVQARRDAGVSIATIRRDLTALSSVLEFAIDEGDRDDDDNPALFRLKRLKERRDPIVLPDHSFIEHVIGRASPAMRGLIRAALVTGCRLSELTTAHRSQLDHDRRQLTVTGKGNKLRVIDLDGGGYEVLRALPARLGCNWLFWHHDGSPFTGAAVAFHELVRRVIKEAYNGAQARGEPIPTLRPFRFHDLRHRHAVDWLKDGRSIYDLQKRLGHTSVKTTEVYLSHLTPDETRAAMYGTGAAVTQTESHHKRSGSEIV
jgi:integrase/recombinase XerD